MTGLAPFGFATAAEIRFGRGRAGEAADAVPALGRRVLLCHGGNAARADWLAEALTRQGCHVLRQTCAQEPDLPLLTEALAAARPARIEVVVGLGGGSVIDLAKALAALLPSPSNPLDHLEVVGAGRPLTAAPLPCIALPTTAGTGSEVTRNAVIGVPEAGRKVSLRDRRMLPALAIVDPALTDGLPRHVTLAGGLDAVTQVIEPYLSSRANPMTDALCRDAIPRGLSALRRLMTDPDDGAARDDMAWVSLCGGLALANAGLGAVHGLAGPLGGATGAAHGAICGALLPWVLVANRAALGGDAARLDRIDQVFAHLAATLGGPAEHAPRTLADWANAQGLPGLAAQGLAETDIDRIAEQAAGSSSMKANPVPLPPEVLAEAMRRAL